MACSSIAFANLRAEMARKNISIQDIAKTLGVNRDTASGKLSRKRAINLDEAFVIERKLFPGYGVEYLFQELSQPSQCVECNTNHGDRT